MERERGGRGAIRDTAFQCVHMSAGRRTGRLTGSTD